MAASQFCVDPASRIGRVELGCFRLAEIIGYGSWGLTYRAEQLGFDRDAVVKVAHAQLLRSRDGELLRRRFHDELRATTRVEHANLVTLYTAGETSDGLPAIAMELVPGEPLEDVLRGYAEGLSAELLGPALTQLGSALVALHGAGVVHRDLSPRNIMIDPDGAQGPRIKILDFGVARLPESPQHTSGPVGTPRYMAPEQFRGDATIASDMFSVGSILWWALTGEEYRGDLLTMEDLHRISTDERIDDDPRTIAPELPAQVAGLVRRLLARRQELRPSAEEFVREWASVGALLADRSGPRYARNSGQALRWNDLGATTITGVSDPSDEPGADSTAPPPTLDRLEACSTEPDDEFPRREARVEASVEASVEAIDTSLVAQFFDQEQGSTTKALEMFVGQMADAFARLVEHHWAADEAAIGEECRALLKPARALGARRLAGCIQDVAGLAARGQLDAVPGAVAQMKREYSRVFRALMNVHASMPTARSR